MRRYDLSFGDIDILRTDELGYLFAVYDDKGKRIYVKSMNLKTLSRISKLLEAYVQSEMGWKGKRHGEKGGAR